MPFIQCVQTWTWFEEGKWGGGGLLDRTEMSQENVQIRTISPQ